MKNTREFWQKVYTNYNESGHEFLCISDSNFSFYWGKDAKFKNECFRLRDIFLEQYNGDKSFVIKDSNHRYVLFTDKGGPTAHNKRREIRSEFLKWVIENNLFNF